jgi:4-hydroxybenzoyl-CoA thioesterase
MPPCRRPMLILGGNELACQSTGKKRTKNPRGTSSQMGFSFKKSFIVGWGDCAPSGAVYYPNYFRWFDQSVWDLFDAADLPIPALEQKYGIVGLPLVNLSCSFRAVCRLRDRVTLETRIAAIEVKGFKIEHLVTRDGQELVTATDERFWGVRPKNEPGRLRREAIPDDVIAHLKTAETRAAGIAR